ncbi:hypothetical protein RND81_13G105700 [Saponaria officinalis]|uniref:Transmembrane protein n=1 Tax=Saponaria officinalis TaxID=3572 RepID=A0AAW1GZU6_SAPOF
MATTSFLPNQQPPPLQIQEVPYPQGVPSNAWHSDNSNNINNNNTGSIGPFFAVISVLAILAVISCIVGRFWMGKEETPLESIKHRGSCFGWLNRKCRRGGDGGGGGAMRVAADAHLPDERGYGGI